MNIDIVNYINNLSDDKKVQELVIKTVGTILLKEKNIDIFIKENNDKIIHIVDWISSIIENNEEWKTPRVLTLEALFNAANKYFEKQNNKLQKIELDKTHEKLIADLGNYYIVQMLTAKALDNESKQMQHCIGHGGYDRKLNKKNYQYLSLRDKYNKAHVTLEIYNDVVLQLQGKQNKLPDDKYLKNLLPWLIKENKNIPWEKIEKYYDNGQLIDFKDIQVIENIDYIKCDNIHDIDIIKYLNEKAKIYFQICKYDLDNYILINNSNDISTISLNENNKIEINIILQDLYNKGYNNIPFSQFDYIINEIDKNIYSIYNIPENCKINENVSFDKNIIVENLPNDLTINGSCYLAFSQIKKINKNVKIKGYLDLWNSKIEEISDNLFVGKNLILGACLSLKKIPNNLHVGGELDLIGSNIKELPSDLFVGNNIILSESKIEKLPDNFIVNGTLNLSSCLKLEELPKTLTVNGSLNLNNNENLIKLPDNLIVANELCLFGCYNIKKLPDNFKCKTLLIDRKQVNLIDRNTDFEFIVIFGREYSKNEFLNILDNNIDYFKY